MSTFEEAAEAAAREFAGNESAPDAVRITSLIPLTSMFFGGIRTLAGFTLSGIAGGSIAAGIQSAIGNVAAGSWFASLQSFGALGGFVSMFFGGLVSLLFFFLW